MIYNNITVGVLETIRESSGEFMTFDKFYYIHLSYLINEGYVIKSKVNNAPDGLEFIGEITYGRFTITDKGKATIDFIDL